MAALVILSSCSMISMVGPRSSAFRRLASGSARSAVVNKLGVKLPDVTLFEGQPEFAKATEYKLGELTAGKTAVIFAVPGAFTPGCSKSHLPSFIEGYDALKAAGVDVIICTATNDP